MFRQHRFCCCVSYRLFPGPGVSGKGVLGMGSQEYLHREVLDPKSSYRVLPVDPCSVQTSRAPNVLMFWLSVSALWPRPGLCGDSVMGEQQPRTQSPGAQKCARNGTGPTVSSPRAGLGQARLSVQFQ